MTPERMSEIKSMFLPEIWESMAEGYQKSVAFELYAALAERDRRLLEIHECLMGRDGTRREARELAGRLLIEIGLLPEVG